MRTKLRLAAGAVALLMIPTITQTLAESLSSNDVARRVAPGLLPAPLAPPSVTTATPSRISASGAMPSRGMTMAQVEQSYGAPIVRKAPVGDPPITRWEYAGFVVYFEYQHVIHSVAGISP